jgi:hypothetical protein
MAKFKINPDLVKILLPVVIPIAKELAAKTETKVDDRLVSALESALSNPVILNLLLSMLAGDDYVFPPASLMSEETSGAIETLEQNSEVVHALFAIAKAD